MIRSGLRFFLLSLISALASVIVATLTSPIAVSLGSDAMRSTTASSLLHDVYVSVFLIPVAILIGGIFALPAAMIMGGAMIWLIARRPHFDRAWAWILAAITGSVPPMFVVGTASDFYPDRVILSLWLVLSGIVGALVFRWCWRKAKAPDVGYLGR